ncbi:ACT domain-containing protein [Candidatus Micrarchaeota archaeon]|nr:ACT domain-containing protein [Candidatus Micrarchaeota archaeon]
MKHRKKSLPSPALAVSAASRIADALAADVHYAKAIELGIANLSAIAQQLAEKTGCSPLAAKVAVARWARGRKAAATAVAERTRRILSRSTLYLQNDVAVLVLENNPLTHRAVFSLQDERILSIVISARSITLIGPPESIAQVEKKLDSHFLKRLDGLCLLQLSSTQEIEDVPGVYAAVLDALARRGINVLETSSCYTDTNVVVRRSDAVKAFEALEDVCGKVRD